MRSEPRDARIPVWALSISLAATLEITVVFFSSGYLDVSVHRVPPVWLWIHHTVTEVSSAGFPHSDICGSGLMCSSPQLFAAYHVFLRLSVPRHPPCALFCLTNSLLGLPFLGCPSRAFAPSVTLLVGRFLVLALFVACFLSRQCSARAPGMFPSGNFRQCVALSVLGCLVISRFAFSHTRYLRLFDSLFGFQGTNRNAPRSVERRSPILSLEWVSHSLEIKGFEPLTPCLQGRCSPN